MRFRGLKLTTLGLALMVALTPIAAQAQSGSQGQQGGLLQPNVPVPASGQMPQLLTGSDVQLTNVLLGSLEVGAQFDDNSILGSSTRQSDVRYFVAPSLSFNETLPRFAWSLSYGPGVGLSEHQFFRDQLTQDFGGQLGWAVTRHGIFQAQQHYLVSTNPFQQFGQEPFISQPGPTVGSNETIFLPGIKRTLILSQAQYTYQISEHSAFGFGGTFSQQSFEHTPQTGPSTSLIRSRVASGEVYFARQVTPRNQLGFQYGGQVLKFLQANARTTTHSFLFFDQVNATPATNFTFYFGPEYSLTRNQVQLALGFIIITIPVSKNSWSTAGGAIYNWTGRRSAVRVEYTRRVSDGAGLLGAVRFNGGSAKLLRKITARWSLELGIVGDDDQLVSVTSPGTELLTYSGNAGIVRQLTKDFSMRMFYSRLNQTGSILGLRTGDHDVVGASLEYHFLKPLGR